MTTPLRVEREGPGGVVARVTLDRPDVHNAFDAALIDELRRTFLRLAEEPPERLRAVVLAGAGPSFCAGADVTWMRASLGLREISCRSSKRPAEPEPWSVSTTGRQASGTTRVLASQCA